MAVTVGRSAGGTEATTLPAALVADLTDWTEHLHARSFTRVSVDMLLRDLRHSVPSALGYTLVLVAGPGLPEVSITVADGRLTPDLVGSTLGFDLPTAHGITATATFYAGTADALDPLAGLLGASATFGAGGVRVGALLAEDVEPGVHGLDDHTRVNYAIGVLLGRGYSVEEADVHLRRLARRLGTLGDAANHLLSTFAA